MAPAHRAAPLDIAVLLLFMLPASAAAFSSSFHLLPRAALRGRRSVLGGGASRYHRSGQSRQQRQYPISSLWRVERDPFCVDSTSSSLFMSSMATSNYKKIKLEAEDDDQTEDEVADEEIDVSEQEDLASDDGAPPPLPRGIPPESYSIISHATVPESGFPLAQIEGAFSKEDVERLKLRPDNVTAPAALLLLFPDEVGSATRARKDCRRSKVLIHRGPLNGDGADKFDGARLHVGKVGDRVYPGDTVALQTRMSPNYDECRMHDDEPPFHLPVVYEDDHFAIVDKPEGVVVFNHKNGGYGRHNVRSCLAWFLTPPRAGVVSVMRRPCPVHRIDRGTSGLLVCAKTKPAMVELAQAFKDRKVKKTYTAIVNGDIEEPKETSITSEDAKNMGVCIGSDANDSTWQIIDSELEDKNDKPQSAVTIWRVLQRYPLENAKNDTVTLVELKPKTGRYHQLRRHMAWVGKCPLLGDKTYDGGGLAKTLRDQGFYLCSNEVTLEHPHYNTQAGRREWSADKVAISERTKGGGVQITEDDDGTVWVHCKIDLPAKFKEFREE